MNIDEFFACEFFEGDVECDEWVDAHCTILGVKNKDTLPSDLVIPARIDEEYYVTEISGGAFSKLDGLKSVSIPDTVRDIGENAFADCKNLNSVILGADIEFISKDAFANCNAIEEVRFADIDSLCNVYFNNKYSNPMYFAKQVYIGDTLIGDCLQVSAKSTWHKLDRIRKYAFCGLKIKTLKIENDIESLTIDTDAFCDCDELTNTVLSDSLKYFDPLGLLACKNLEFNEYGGAQYLGSEKNKYKAFVRAPKDIASLILHPDTEILCKNALKDCVNLQSIYLPSRLTNIAENAFADCFELREIELSEDLKTLNSRELQVCKNIKYNVYGDLKYLGSKSNPYKAVVGCCQPARSYTLHPDTEIISKGAFAYNGALEEFIAPQKLSYINEFAFKGCNSLKKIFISPNVKHIASAFDGCNAIEEVHCPDVSTWCNIKFDAPICGHYDSCFDLYFGDKIAEKIQIPSGIDKLNPYAFSNCGSIKTITLPNGLKSIGNNAFYKCKSLESINFPDGLKTISSYAFRFCDSLKSIDTDAEEIGWMAFESCMGLESVHLTRCKEISAEAFKNCKLLNSVEISGSIEKIYDYTFKNCSSLRSVKLPENLTYIGYEVFRDCRSLEDINIPDGVKSIKMHAFENCRALKSINIPAVEDLDAETFKECRSLKKVNIAVGTKYLSTEMFSWCIALEHVSIPEGVKTIAGEAFYNCGNLENIILPNTLKTIGNLSFAHSGLESIVIPDGVTHICDQAFLSCSSLKRIEIPDSVEHIGYDILKDCGDVEIIASDRIKKKLQKK